MCKYKVGDKVRVKSKEWWDAQQKDEFYSVQCGENVFTKDMVKYCGLEAEIKFSCKHLYLLDIDNRKYCWTDEMLEDIPTAEQYTLYNDLANAINKVVSEHQQSVMVEEIESGIIIKPIEKKEEDLPIDTPVMCSNSIQGQAAWFVRYYAGDGKAWWNLGKSCNEKRKVDWKCIIQFDKFNPNDIEESLKHNIVK